MIKKRKNLLAILAVAMTVLLIYGVASAKRNFIYGNQMREEASRLSIQFYQLADAIAHLENTTSEDQNSLGGDRLAFDSAMSALRSHFGSDDAPFTDDVRSGWLDEIESWDQQTKDDSSFISIFNDETLRNEFSAFKEALIITAAKLDYVYQRYQHMTTIERYLSHWRLEQRLLSESIAVNTNR